MYYTIPHHRNVPCLKTQRKGSGRRCSNGSCKLLPALGEARGDADATDVNAVTGMCSGMSSLSCTRTVGVAMPRLAC
eukprot:CAMPEP_0183344620 /NCGR_PEP_ID=MMETSP0164_2-20130417/10253_1 /TAXON_ID=221442 /ORGANISM="Coccolithus pelagicus ssp braarudi, Strain PLY182g" /LENGTH=76 /DNA_ID=CAMNT_0025515641 /DNA_START=24 /DNA_END=254 /DNA_ORIENTATION=+